MNQATKKVLILHFNDIKKYPPALNTIDFLESIGYKPYVITRTPRIKTSQGLRGRFRHYMSIVKWSWSCIFALKSADFSYVVAYEHLSLPPLLFSLPKVRLWVHFHEYTSREELKADGFYSRFCWSILKTITRSKNLILSHTNSWRLNQFLNDWNLTGKTNIDSRVLENFPMGTWKALARKEWSTIPAKGEPIRCVYHGAAHFETTYVCELIALIESCNGKLTLDIYTDDTLPVKGMNYVTVHPVVPYSTLSVILQQYTIGFVIYNGSLPNFIFNQPNKLWEYLACKIPVVVSASISPEMIDPWMEDVCRRLSFPEVTADEFYTIIEELLRAEKRGIELPDYEELLKPIFMTGSNSVGHAL